uniref:Glycoprotein G n=1 Tax=Caligus rogercresseyi TaxID=217165 RepID=C1BMI6_CALRO|nr:Glycoprotein G precursor [Caligus rogercresseyi]
MKSVFFFFVILFNTMDADLSIPLGNTNNLPGLTTPLEPTVEGRSRTSRKEKDFGEMTVLPLRRLEPWRECAIADLQCPPRYDFGEKIGSLITTEKLWPVRGLSVLQEGYFCTKTSRDRTCSTSFFGSEDLSGSEEYLYPNDSDCLKEVKSLESGRYSPPVWPEHTCAWMATRTVTLVQYQLNLHNVLWEDIGGTYHDAKLKGGKCSTRICSTNNPGVLWIRGKKANHLLRPEDRLPCKIYENKTSSILQVHCDYHHPLHFKVGACKFSYRGESGIRSEEGVGLAWDLKKGSKIARYVGPECDKKKTPIYQWSANSKFRYDAATKADDDLHARCLDALVRIREHKDISQWDLGYFYPSSPGPFPAYRLNKSSKVLECSKYLFTLKEVKSGRSLVDYLPEESIIPDPRTGEKLGVSGLIVKNDSSVYVPHQRSNQMISWEHHLGPKDKVEISRMSLTPNVDDNTLLFSEDPQNHATENGTSQATFLSHLGFGIEHLFYTLLGLSIAGLVGVCVVKVCLENAFKCGCKYCSRSDLDDYSH